MRFAAGADTVSMRFHDTAVLTEACARREIKSTVPSRYRYFIFPLAQPRPSKRLTYHRESDQECAPMRSFARLAVDIDNRKRVSRIPRSKTLRANPTAATDDRHIPTFTFSNGRYLARRFSANYDLNWPSVCIAGHLVYMLPASHVLAAWSFYLHDAMFARERSVGTYFVIQNQPDTVNSILIVINALGQRRANFYRDKNIIACIAYVIIGHSENMREW